MTSCVINDSAINEIKTQIKNSKGKKKKRWKLELSQLRRQVSPQKPMESITVQDVERQVDQFRLVLPPQIHADEPSVEQEAIEALQEAIDEGLSTRESRTLSEFITPQESQLVIPTSKAARVEMAKKLKNEGKEIEEISSFMSLSERTIKDYLKG